MADFQGPTQWVEQVALQGEARVPLVPATKAEAIDVRAAIQEAGDDGGAPLTLEQLLSGDRAEGVNLDHISKQELVDATVHHNLTHDADLRVSGTKHELFEALYDAVNG